METALPINSMKLFSNDKLVKFDDDSFIYHDSYGEETYFAGKDRLCSWLSENQIDVDEVEGLERFIEGVTLFDVYDGAFDSSANPEDQDLLTLEKIKEYIDAYADGMSVHLTPEEVQKIADVYVEYEAADFDPEFQNQFFQMVSEPLDIPVKNQ